MNARFRVLRAEVKLPERFTFPFCYEPHPLCVMAAKEVQCLIAEHKEWHEEISKGKMFGVLVVEHESQVGYLAAYSGQLMGCNDVEPFVPAVYDMLVPGGYYKTKEAEITDINNVLEGCSDEEQMQLLKKRRRVLSEFLQDWLFRQFRMKNAMGEERDLTDIFRDTTPGYPPSGAGECCAPKLLQYAYNNGMKPLCMAEFWWGASPKGDIRHHLQYYPACSGKCKPILRHMLTGIDVDPDPLASLDGGMVEIIYEDEAVVVVNKPSGMLSVPGNDARPSVQTAINGMIVHRLDMDTSGLMVVARTPSAYHNLQDQFLRHEVKKTYRAIVDCSQSHLSTHGSLRVGEKGAIDLPLAPDPMDRPRQVIDHERGKRSITEYHVVAVADSKAMLLLRPHTGRTHQLRVHCASMEGLGAPILGDRLYGDVHSAERLMLHAERLTFTHPVTDKEMHFSRELPLFNPK